MVNKMDCFRFDRTVGPPCANTASAIKAWSQWLRRDVVMVLLRDHWAIAYRFKEFGRADVLHSSWLVRSSLGPVVVKGFICPAPRPSDLAYKRGGSPRLCVAFQW